MRNFKLSPDILRMVKSWRKRCVEHVRHMKDKRNAYRFLIQKPEGKRPLGKPRCRWKSDIEMEL
jgi:hypothetical protein